eukprot:Awhi_evm1s11113
MNSSPGRTENLIMKLTIGSCCPGLELDEAEKVEEDSGHCEFNNGFLDSCIAQIIFFDKHVRKQTIKWVRRPIG